MRLLVAAKWREVGLDEPHMVLRHLNVGQSICRGVVGAVRRVRRQGRPVLRVRIRRGRGLYSFIVLADDVTKFLIESMRNDF